MKKIIITIIVLLVIVTGGYIGIRIYKNHRQNSNPVNVYSLESFYNENWYEETENLNGSVSSNNDQRIAIDSEKTVKEIYVKVGDKVKAGDPILAYDTTSESLKLSSMYDQLSVYEAKLKIANNELVKLQNTTPTEEEDDTEDDTEEETTETTTEEKTTEKKKKEKKTTEEKTTEKKKKEKKTTEEKTTEKKKKEKKTTEEKTSEEKTTEEKTTEEKTTEEKTSEEGTSEEKTSEDNTAQNNTQNDEVVEAAVRDETEVHEEEVTAIVQPVNQDTHVFDEDDDDDDYDDGDDNDYDYDYDDDYDDDDGETKYTQYELTVAIAQKKDDINEIQNDIDTKSLEIRKQERVISQATVVAESAGTVIKVNETGDDEYSEGYIVISSTGVYTATVSVSELKLDDYEIGASVTVYCYDTGSYYDGKIIDKGTTPNGSTSYPYLQSTYPMKISIDSPEGLEEGAYVEVTYNGVNDNGAVDSGTDEGIGPQNASETDSTASTPAASETDVYSGSETDAIVPGDDTGDEGMMEDSMMMEENLSAEKELIIPMFFVKQEHGKYYVMKRVDDRLKKTYIKTGKIYYGNEIVIKSGLKPSDFVAFPYDKNATEGKICKEADLDSIY